MDYDTHIQLSFDLIELYSDVERELLTSIGRRFAKHYDEMVAGDIMDWQIRQLLEVGELRKEHIEIMRKSARVSRERMIEMLTEAGYTSAGRYEDFFKEAYVKGLIKLNPSAADNSMRLLRVLNTYINQAEDTLNLVNTTMLQSGQDTFLDTVNQVVAYVSTGIKTPQVAMRDALKNAGQKGLTVFRAKNGAQWSTETYLNMITRTMNSNISNAVEDERRHEYGVDYIEVSSHAGARPRCAPYQGRIYYDGVGDDPLEKYPHFSETSYGEAAGLFGVNCGHHKYPYVPGMSKQTFFPYSKSENDKTYAESQVQRKLEREVKQLKRERAILTAAKDKEGAKLASQRLENKWQELRQFTAQTGRTRRYDREKSLNTILSEDKKKAIVKDNLKIRDEYRAIKKAIPEVAPKNLETYYDMRYNGGKIYEDLVRDYKDYIRWSKAEFPTKKSFEGHIDSHLKEFPGLTGKQYQKKAADLLSRPITDNILGYDTDSRRVRYDLENNIFALGRVKQGTITTMLKPKEGVDYFDNDWKREFDNLK